MSFIRSCNPAAGLCAYRPDKAWAPNRSASRFRSLACDQYHVPWNSTGGIAEHRCFTLISPLVFRDPSCRSIGTNTLCSMQMSPHPSRISTMSTPAQSPLATGVDDKPNAVEHHELSALPDIKSSDVPATVTSRYANLSLRATLSTFPMATAYALMAAFNAANDGYCYSIPGASDETRVMRRSSSGNVIAMPGFIAKFGKDYDGVTQLDAKDVAAWGAIYTAGYIAILFLGSPLNDLLGRKWCMFLVQLFMVLSTVISLVAENPGTWGAAKVFQVRAPVEVWLTRAGFVCRSRSSHRAILRIRDCPNPSSWVLAGGVSAFRECGSAQL